MASSWDTFAREGQEGSGGDFPDRPHVPDGVYKAEVTRIGEPYDKANAQSGEMETKFAVEFTLYGKRIPEGTILPSFPKITTKFLDSGFLHPKATLYKIMAGLGYDMTHFYFDPQEWVGRTCQVVVKNEDGTSWITDYLRLEDEDDAPAAAPPPARPAARPQPAAAGARPARRQADPEWDE